MIEAGFGGGICRRTDAHSPPLVRFREFCGSWPRPRWPSAPGSRTRPVQFIVPAGTGGGADQMARVIQGIVSKHALMRQPVVVVNKAGGAGAEGFLEAKGARGNPHMLVISLSNIFTTPLATGVPFSWRDLTPVAMMALDEFVLWVNAASPYATVAEFIAAAKRGGCGWAAPARGRRTRSSPPPSRGRAGRR